MTACTSFLAFFAEQMLAFAVKMHSRPGRCPSEARRAEGASTRSAQSKAAKRLEARGHAQRASATPEHRAAEGEGGAQRRNTAQALAQRGAKTSGRVILVDKPKVCQRSVSIETTRSMPARSRAISQRPGSAARKICATSRACPAPTSKKAARRKRTGNSRAMRR